jgi:MFS family permease
MASQLDRLDGTAVSHTATMGADSMLGGEGRYKWIALSNTTLGVLMATIDLSIVLIALPDIFRGIHVDPLAPSNSFYLLWMILGFMIVTSVLVVTFGRLGDMYGRVRIYNLGFAVYTFFSLLLAVTWMSGTAAAVWLVVMRVFQGVGAAMLIANSAAILTDAFPEHERGMALGINQIAGISGSFIGLLLGGVLAPIQWRLIFLVSVPVGIFGTIWAYLRLREVPRRTNARLDWPGNVAFALGLVAVMVGITYGIQPHGSSTMGWESPFVLSCLAAGLALLGAFAAIEHKTADPMFRLGLFRIRAFTAGSLSTLLASIGRGGLMFMLIIWLQGIWLPRHGYSFNQTPLWAGIFMLPLTAGFLLAGPLCGYLSDRFGSRPFASGGMVAAAASFVLLEMLPINFSYAVFAPVLLMNGLAMGAFAAPNRAGVMNSLPAEHRGAGSGMNATFLYAGQVLSIGIFFTLMIIGLSSALPFAVAHGLVSNGVPRAVADKASRLPAVSTLFAALLGYNPVQHLIGTSVLAHLPAADAAVLRGRSFFPSLISAPFKRGLRAAFDFAAGACLLAAAMSWLRGGKVDQGGRTRVARLALLTLPDCLTPRRHGCRTSSATPSRTVLRAGATRASGQRGPPLRRSRPRGRPSPAVRAAPPDAQRRGIRTRRDAAVRRPPLARWVIWEGRHSTSVGPCRAAHLPRRARPRSSR